MLKVTSGILFLSIIIYIVYAFFAGNANYWIIIVLLATFLPLHYYVYVTRKPIVSTKAQLIKKLEVTRATRFQADYLLPDKSVVCLEMSKEQFKLLKVNDIGELVYKGYKCISFQRATDKAPIKNNDFEVRLIAKKNYVLDEKSVGLDLIA